MNMRSIFFLTLFCFSLGYIFHAYQKEWIILNFPFQTTSLHEQQTNETYTHEKMALYFWKNNSWQYEYSTMIWSSDTAQNCKTLLNNLIVVLEDETIIESDIQIMSATISSNKELLISFNKNIYSSEHATYDKLMIIHSFLKTLYENKIPVQSVRFLIHHHTIIDDHLNFSLSWPVTGYMP